MSTIIKDEAPKFDPTPQGLFNATCVQVALIGPQTSTFEGETKTLNKIVLVFELPTVRRKWKKDDVEHEGPAQISNTYTISLHEKSNLRKLLAGWRGRDFTAAELGGFDIEQVLGTHSQILVKHNTKGDRTYANLDSMIKYEGEKMTPEAELVFYNAAAHNEETFKKLHPWIQKKVVLPDGSFAFKEDGSNENVQNAQTLDNDPDSDNDEIPF